MFAVNLVKYLPRRVSASVGYVIKPLTDAFLCIGAGGNVEQALIGFGVLHEAAAFPFTVSTTGRVLFLSCFMKSPERRRKVVSDWMFLVMSSMACSYQKHLFRRYQNALTL